MPFFFFFFPSQTKKTSPQVGKRVFPNVSPSLRRELWLSVLQRSRAASRAAASYPSLLLSAFPSNEELGGEATGEKGGAVPLEVRDAIRRDVGRTFPYVDGFEPEDPAAKQQLGRRARSLANVLTAYAAFDPAVSYCQGMNFLGGLLLLYLDDNGDGDGKGKGSKKKQRSEKKKINENKIDKKKRSERDGEEEVDFDSEGGFDDTLTGDDSAERAAFGLLTHLLMSKGLRQLYTEGMEALTARLRHLQLLLPPDIKQLFDEDLGGFSVTLFAAPWFMSAYAADFPSSIAARIVDAMMTTTPAVDRPLLRLAAACVRACRKELLSAKDAEAAVRVLRKDLPSRKASRLHDLVSQAFEREWSAEESAILSSEHPRLTTEEQPQTEESSSSSPPSSSAAAAAAVPPLPPSEQREAAAAAEDSARGSSPSAAAAGNQHEQQQQQKQQQQQHRKLKWEDALLARRAASVDREVGAEPGGAAGAAPEEEGGSRGGTLRLPLPLLPPPVAAQGAAPAAATEARPSERGSTASAAEALAELLGCRLELDSPSSSAPPYPCPAATAAAAATARSAPPPFSDSLWTSFRKAAEEEPGRGAVEGPAASPAAVTAAAAAARERAAADLDGWSSFQRSASLTAAPPTEAGEEKEGDDDDERK